MYKKIKKVQGFETNSMLLEQQESNREKKCEYSIQN